MKRIRLFAITALLVFTLACGGLLDNIQSGWRAVKPFSQTLVAQGVITQAKADVVIRDVDDTLAAGDAAEQCISGIPSDISKSERRVRKAQCYYNFAITFRIILQRHNIGGSPQLDRIAAIGQGFILALEEYYRRVTGDSTPTFAAMSVDAEKKLKSDLDAKLAELKAATKH